MMWRTVAATWIMVDGARIKSHDISDSIVNVTEGANPVCDSLWHPELDQYFKNKVVWGSGATACVFGGEDETGTLVAIKVGKPTESIAGWRAECAEMKLMRYSACKSGKEALALHEEYMPTCTKVGQTKDKKRNFYVMHAGGTIAYRNLPKEPLTPQNRKNIFAQLVASVHALHSVDYTHNDLHGQNIVLNQDYKLALIDFGSLKTVANANKNGYKRDSNAIWRWGAVVFDCGEAAQWIPDLPNKKVPKQERYSRAGNFNACLKNNGADSNTLKVVKRMTDACIAEEAEQHVSALYTDAFVQANLKAPSKTHFPFPEAAGCLAWSDEQMQQAVYKTEFGNHYKCETTPNWIKTRTKTRPDGRVKVRKTPQCNSPDLISACITTKKDIGAACGGGLNMRLPCENLPIGETGSTYSGACLKPAHPAYVVAQPYP